jgi:CRISPR-associated endoribonuclease Cas6
VPAYWQVRLTGQARNPIPLEAPHAVVSRWLDTDHKAPVKPYAVSPPRVTARETFLEVRLLDDTLAPRLQESAAPGTQVRLGSNFFTITTQPVQAKATPWPDLTHPAATPDPTHPVPPRAWWLSFLSPVTFRDGDRSSPWPAPESVTRSLADRWRALHPATAPHLTITGTRSLWVADLDGTSQPCRLAGRIVSGFVGRIRYVCDGSDAEAAAINALLRFAGYAGTGSHTAYGFGLTRTEPEPGTRRAPQPTSRTPRTRPA